VFAVGRIVATYPVSLPAQRYDMVLLAGHAYAEPTAFAPACLLVVPGTANRHTLNEKWLKFRGAPADHRVEGSPFRLRGFVQLRDQSAGALMLQAFESPASTWLPDDRSDNNPLNFRDCQPLNPRPPFRTRD